MSDDNTNGTNGSGGTNGSAGAKDPNDFSFEDLQLDELQTAEEENATNHELPPLHPLFDETAEKGLTAVYDVPVQISAVLGKAVMPVNQLLKLGRGAVIELDRRVGESVDVYVNNRLIARGEVVIVEDRLGITMTEIIKLN